MVTLLLFLCFFVCVPDSAPNERPVVGILAQDFYVGRKKADDTYIAASYVKFVESAGAQVVPVMVNQSDSYYRMIFNKTNGLLLPGGAVYLNDSDYGRTASKLLDIVLQNPSVYYPVWGTCLGFEMIMYYFNNKTDNTLQACSALNVRNHLQFTTDGISSKMFKSPYFSKNIMNILAKENVTANYHGKCVLKETFINSSLKKQFTIISTNTDLKGKVYISAVESKSMPIYGVQFHPEKNNFEWGVKSSLTAIPHSLEAVLVSQYFANFFVQEARKNDHSMSYEDFNKMAIYNYSPTFTGRNNSSFTQKYFFYKNMTSKELL